MSLTDYENFALFFAGVDKARAERRRGLIHVYVAGPVAEPVPRESALLRNLSRAYRDYGDPTAPVLVTSYEPRLIFILARIRIDPRYEWPLVESQIRATLLDTHGYGASRFGQDVLAADIISNMQGVGGVVYVDLDHLSARNESEPEGHREGAERDKVPPVSERIDVKTSELCYLTPEVPDSLRLLQVL